MNTIRNENFNATHRPQTIEDLVIADPDIRAMLEHYVAGKLSSHVLLYGPPGSGKTIAAHTASRLRNMDKDGKPRPVVSHPAIKLNQEGSLNAIRGECHYQPLFFGPDPIVVIDEIDQLNESLQFELRVLIDEHLNMTLMGTTNYLHRVQEPLRDRFDKYEVKHPSHDDWRIRVQAILAKEGFADTAEPADKLMKNWNGSARDLMRHLEKFCRAKAK